MKGKTRYQKRLGQLRTGKAYLLELDVDRCPKRGGPPKAGFLDCKGCRYNVDHFFGRRMCSHKGAAQVAAEAIERAKEWEAEWRKQHGKDIRR
jgi:hypothetical protein